MADAIFICTSSQDAYAHPRPRHSLRMVGAFLFLIPLMTSCVSLRESRKREVLAEIAGAAKMANDCAASMSKQAAKHLGKEKDLIERLRQFNQVDKNGDLIPLKGKP